MNDFIILFEDDLRDVVPQILKDSVKKEIPMYRIFQFINKTDKNRILSQKQSKFCGLFEYFEKETELRPLIVNSKLIYCEKVLKIYAEHPDCGKPQLMNDLLQVILKKGGEQIRLNITTKMLQKLRRLFMKFYLEGLQTLESLAFLLQANIPLNLFNLFDQQQILLILSYYVYEEIALPQIISTIQIKNKKIQFNKEKLSIFLQGQPDCYQILKKDVQMLAEDGVIENQLAIIYKKRSQFNVMEFIVYEKFIDDLRILEKYHQKSIQKLAQQLILHCQYVVINTNNHSLQEFWRQEQLLTFKKKIIQILLNVLIELRIVNLNIFECIFIHCKCLNLKYEDRLLRILSQYDELKDIYYILELDQLDITNVDIKKIVKFEFQILPQFSKFIYQDDILINGYLTLIENKKEEFKELLIQLLSTKHIINIISYINPEHCNENTQLLLSIFNYAKQQNQKQINTYDIIAQLQQLVHHKQPYPLIMTYIQLDQKHNFVLSNIDITLKQDLDDKLCKDYLTKRQRNEDNNIVIYDEHEVLKEMLILIKQKGIQISKFKHKIDKNVLQFFQKL